MRSHSGADQAPSPFAELLDGCETSEPGAVDPAAKTDAAAPSEKAPVDAVPQQDKANGPVAVTTVTEGATIAEIPAELMLAITMAGQQSVPEEEGTKPATSVGPDAAVADETKSDADTSLQQADTSNAPDTPEAAIPVAQPAPLPTVVPVSAPLPVVAEAESIPATAPPVAGVTATSVVEPIVTVSDADMPASVDRSTEMAAPAAPAGKEKVPSPEKPAAATVAVTARDDKATTSPRIARPAADAEAASPNTDISAQKASAPAAEAPAPKTKSGNVETPDAAPKMAAEQPSPKDNVPSPALPAQVLTHSAAPQHAAEPSAVQRSLADSPVPIAGLAVEIAAHAQTGKNRFEIRLDPPELGRIDVQLDVDSNGQVTSHLRVERAETLDLLRRDAPALERALQQAGFKTSDSGLQFSLRDQSFFQQNQGRDTPAMARIVVPDEKLVPVETQRQYGRIAGPGSGVDIRV